MTFKAHRCRHECGEGTCREEGSGVTGVGGKDQCSVESEQNVLHTGMKLSKNTFSQFKTKTKPN